MSEDPFGVTIYTVICEFKSWEGCGDGGGDYRGRREARPCASSGVQRRPVVLSIFSTEPHGIKQPPCPSGQEDPSGHLRGAKWLQSLPLGEICLIEACSFSALTGADGGITIL